MADEVKCPIWGTLASERKLPKDIYRVDSSRAGGVYEITFEATEDLPAMAGSVEEKRKITYEIIRHAIANSTLRITTTTLEAVTRQFNHIVWTDADDLCTKLKNRIGAVIGDGPLKPEGEA